MKTCSKCHQEKSLEYFSINKRNKKDGRAWHCKECHREHDRIRNSSPKRKQDQLETNKRLRERNRLYIWEYLSRNPCVRCKEADPIVLEFDHLESSTKVADVGTTVRRLWNIKKIQEEIDKCQILCANCHRRKTAETQGWYSTIQT